jgi:hypothetical protein
VDAAKIVVSNVQRDRRNMIVQLRSAEEEPPTKNTVMRLLKKAPKRQP